MEPNSKTELEEETNNLIIKIKPDIKNVVKTLAVSNKDLNTIYIEDPVIKKVIKRVKIIEKDPSSALNVPIISKGTIKITNRLILQAYNKFLILVKDHPVNKKNIVILLTYAIEISNEMLNMERVYIVELSLIIIRKLIDEKVKDFRVRSSLHNTVELSIQNLMEEIDDDDYYVCCC